MSKKESYILFIVEELKKGNIERATVLAGFGKKWQKGVRSFDRYWKEANNRHLETIQSIEEQKKELYTKSQIKGFKEGIKSVEQQKKEISEKIDFLESKIKDFYAERSEKSKLKSTDIFKMEETILKYRAELNKMIGAYAPVKVETDITVDWSD